MMPAALTGAACGVVGARRVVGTRASCRSHGSRPAPPSAFNGGRTGGGYGEMERGGDSARSGGPLGAEREVFRQPDEYEYDYAPPRGGGEGREGEGSRGGWGSNRPGAPAQGDGGGGNGLFGGLNGGRGGGGGGPPSVTNFLIAGAFVVGMGAGVAFDTAVDLEPSNVASREILDRQTPSSEVCMANGASAMVFDQRVFMSFNPFNIYVAQPEVKPGCVLRRSNWNVLEREKLVDNAMEADCKRGMNTFAFVGDLDKSPEVSCVYHSEEAENQYMKDPKSAVLGDGFVTRNKPFR